MTSGARRPRRPAPGRGRPGGASRAADLPGGAPDDPLSDLEAALGHRFADRALLDLALIHRSHAHEKGTPGLHNESMEFLGDAVLSLGVSQMLYRRFGREEVGELARARAFLVSEPNLARKARGLDLGRHLRLGRGEEKGGGRDKDSLLSDAYEAVLAAVYLDGGLESAAAVVHRQFSAQIARVRPGARTAQDFKTDLQEALQAVGLPVPIYRVEGESGPDHRKMFTVTVSIGDRQVARGEGTSKKAAEQMAARQALRGIEKVIAEILASSGGGPG